MPVIDDGIRERHGVQCRKAEEKLSTIDIWEHNEKVWLGGNYEDRSMTEWQARYLAAKLYRLSRRIRARREASE